MIDVLRKNIEKEIEILREVSLFSKRIEVASPGEKRMLSEGLNSLTEALRNNNNLTADILSKIQLEKEDQKIEATNSIKKNANNVERYSSKDIMPKLAERKDFLKELNINESVLKKLRKDNTGEEKPQDEGFKEARGYLKLSNKYFLEISSNLIKKGYFRSLPSEIKKSNLDILFETYVATILFSTFISFFVSLFLVLFLLFFNIGISWPFISVFSGDYTFRILSIIWIPIVVPISVFFIVYYYPSAEKRSIANKINDELPFAVIHMNSISGSGIAPTEIFKIIALSKEYPYLRKEIRKVLNQINVYGYDLVTALNNVSKSTSSTKLAELFSGLGTTINSGGELSEFFEKRAESLLLEYRLEREKAIKVAETAMDIYISVVIAAPMILMLLLVMISVSGIQIGFTPYELTFMTIGGVALINILFLVYLQTRKDLY